MIIIPGTGSSAGTQHVASLNNHNHCEKDCADAFEKRTGFKISTIKRVPEGKRSVVYRVKTENDRQYALKFVSRGSSRDLSRELLFYELVKRRAPQITVPNIHTADFSGDIIDMPFLISSWLPGDTIKQRAVDGGFKGDEALFQRFGKLIGTIHSIDIDTGGFGRVHKDNTGRFLTTGALPEILRGSRESTEERYTIPARESANYLVRERVLSEAGRDRIEHLLSNGIPEGGDTVILHGDMSTGNFLTDGHDVTGIIDGAGNIGYRAEELAGMRLHLHALALYFPGFDGETAFGRFMKGYTGIFDGYIPRVTIGVFLAIQILQHTAILFERGANAHIARFVDFFSKELNSIYH